MAHHVEREITTTRRREPAFYFVADFSTTQEWDPKGIQAASGSATARSGWDRGSSWCHGSVSTQNYRV